MTEQLLPLLNHPSPGLSRSAASKLADLGERRAVEPLLDILRDCTQRVHAVGYPDQRCLGAIEALARLKDPRAFEPLLHLFQNARGAVQHFAARSLAAQGDPRAVPILLDALPAAANDPQLRHAILTGLAVLRAPEAIPGLIGEFTDPDQSNVAHMAARQVMVFGQAAVPALREALRHPDSRVRQWAVVAFEEMAAPERRKTDAVRWLADALQDESASVRWQAARVLGKWRNKSVIDALLPLQNDPDDEVRTIVASSLRKLGARAGPRLPKPGPNRWVFRPYADYNQFYLGDSEFEPHTDDPGFWSKEAFDRGLAVSPPSMLGVGTSRYDVVPVVVELAERAPPEDGEEWDRIVEASLEVPSGRLAIDGCISYRPATSPQIKLAPGTYRVRVYSAGLTTHDEDWYRVVLWAEAQYKEPRVVRAVSRTAQRGVDGSRTAQRGVDTITEPTP